MKCLICKHEFCWRCGGPYFRSAEKGLYHYGTCSLFEAPEQEEDSVPRNNGTNVQMMDRRTDNHEQPHHSLEAILTRTNELSGSNPKLRRKFLAGRLRERAKDNLQRQNAFTVRKPVLSQQKPLNNQVNGPDYRNFFNQTNGNVTTERNVVQNKRKLDEVNGISNENRESRLRSKPLTENQSLLNVSHSQRRIPTKNATSKVQSQKKGKEKEKENKQQMKQLTLEEMLPFHETVKKKSEKEKIELSQALATAKPKELREYLNKRNKPSLRN